jgi:flavin-dependent dehydrogenase
VTAFSRHAAHVTAAGVEARYLVAADGLHSTIRRALEGDAGVAPARPGPRDPASPGPPRYGLRRHYRVAPWSDLVEVHWRPGAEAYVTPVSADVVGVAVLFAKPHQDEGRQGETGGDFTARLSAFPALLDRLGGAAPASEVRGAGPMRQDVRRRVAGRVLLAGDASGYVDALTGEGISVGLAQADALAACLAVGRPADYERAWRRASGPAWRFTAGLLWSRNQPLLGPRIVPAAQRFPWLFAALVNHAANA